MIYRSHLKNYLKLSLIYLALIFMTTTIFLSLYPSYLENESNLRAIYNALSPTILSILKIDQLSFSNILYYYAIYLNLGLILYLLLATHLAIKTIHDDNIYLKIFITKPLKKSTYLKKKIGLALLNILGLNILMYLYLITYLSFYDVSSLYLTLFLIQLAIFLASLTIYSIVLAVAAFIKKNSLTILVALALLAFFVILSIIYKVTNFKPLAYICPLCYFDYLKIILNHTLGLDYLASIVVISVFGLNLALCESEGEAYV